MMALGLFVPFYDAGRNVVVIGCFEFELRKMG